MKKTRTRTGARAKVTRGAAASLQTKAFELSMAAPQVVAQRLTRMGQAGLRPTSADHREMRNMVNEKVVAFQQSWLAMQSTVIEQQARTFQSLLLGAFRGPMGLAQAMHHSTVAASSHLTQVLQAGISPVHARAMANARRLSRNR